MKEQLYYDIWRKALPDILDLLELLPAYSMKQFSPIEFHNAGNRKNYNFRLELSDGRVINNIDGSAVARDLADIILDSARAINFLKGKHIVIRMDQNFSLHLNQLTM